MACSRSAWPRSNGACRSRAARWRRFSAAAQEAAVNHIAGEELLAFQSRHPNRGRHVSGRSGGTTVFGVLSFCLTAVTACAWMAIPLWPDWIVQVAYGAYVVSVATDVVATVWGLGRYVYRKAPAGTSPLFVGLRFPE